MEDKDGTWSSGRRGDGFHPVFQRRNTWKNAGVFRHLPLAFMIHIGLQAKNFILFKNPRILYFVDSYLHMTYAEWMSQQFN